jgi:hypothetical protein
MAPFHFLPVAIVGLWDSALIYVYPPGLPDQAPIKANFRLLQKTPKSKVFLGVLKFTVEMAN